MARPSGKLKVFQAQFGFFDSIVAAPSQAAALRAWNTNQNLFAQGLAKIITDEEAVASALKHPGIPLRRALGSSEPFSLKAAPPKIDALEPVPAKPKVKPPAAVKIVPDRRRLDAAEAALADRDADEQTRETEIDRRRRGLAREEAELARRKQALEAEAAEGKKTAEKKRAAALAEVDREREAYRRSGGEV